MGDPELMKMPEKAAMERPNRCRNIIATQGKGRTIFGNGEESSGNFWMKSFLLNLVVLKLLSVTLLILAVATTTWSKASAIEIFVQTSRELRGALQSAEPGDSIILDSGEFKLPKTVIRKSGKPGAPIVVKALIPGKSVIKSSVIELFKLKAPYWIFENLNIVGNNSTHHAFHIVGNAHHVILRGNTMRNFHAAIKGNPERGHSPNYVTIERNAFYNDGLRQTGVPVTPIDVVGGTNWIVRQNFIADFGKGAGDGISYGAFLKAGSENGLFERNLVVCAWKNFGGRRVGLSFGGGGSGACRSGACEAEHKSGIMRNNIILNCTDAPGIYLNRAMDSKIYNNTIYNSYGILARFSANSSDVRNNIVSGAISVRDRAKIVAENNIETGWKIGAYIPGAAEKLKTRISDYHVKFPSWFDASDISWAQKTIDSVADWLGETMVGRGIGEFENWFVAPGLGNFSLLGAGEIIGRGQALEEVTDDFCGQPRNHSSVALGAVEYSIGECSLDEWLFRIVGPLDLTN